MTIFKDFSENGRLLDQQDKIVDKINLERYIKEHGVEKAAGYLDALIDICKELEPFLYSPSKDNIRQPRSAPSVQRNMKTFFYTKQDLIDKMNEELKKPSENASIATPQL